MKICIDPEYHTSFGYSLFERSKECWLLCLKNQSFSGIKYSGNTCSAEVASVILEVIT